jgi:hypothetical protein
LIGTALGYSMSDCSGGISRMIGQIGVRPQRDWSRLARW